MVMKIADAKAKVKSGLKKVTGVIPPVLGVYSFVNAVIKKDLDYHEGDGSGYSDNWVWKGADLVHRVTGIPLGVDENNMPYLKDEPYKGPTIIGGIGDYFGSVIKNKDTWASLVAIFGPIIAKRIFDGMPESVDSLLSLIQDSGTLAFYGILGGTIFDPPTALDEQIATSPTQMPAHVSRATEVSAQSANALTSSYWKGLNYKGKASPTGSRSNMDRYNMKPFAFADYKV